MNWTLKGNFISTGAHPRVLVDGFEIAKRATLQFLEKFKTPVVMGDEPDKEILEMVARTTLRTKVSICSVILSISWSICLSHQLRLTILCFSLYAVVRGIGRSTN